MFIGGAVVQWLRDGLGLIRSAPDIEPLAASAPDNGGVYLVPAFAGLGAPHWDQYARGAMFGLTRGATAAHIARAALESIAYQVADVLDAMQADSHIRLSELRVDGGASNNGLLMQFQADILGVPVVRCGVAETTALGAAYLAGLAAGFWKSPEEVSSHWHEGARFEPADARLPGGLLAGALDGGRGARQELAPSHLKECGALMPTRRGLSATPNATRLHQRVARPAPLGGRTGASPGPRVTKQPHSNRAARRRR